MWRFLTNIFVLINPEQLIKIEIKVLRYIAGILITERQSVDNKNVDFM
jgi:hypothetical protein